jgi:hypothetical protein
MRNLHSVPKKGIESLSPIDSNREIDDFYAKESGDRRVEVEAIP